MENETHPSSPVTYWVNRQEHIALVRVNEITVQGWKVQGRNVSGEFEHSHFQTIYPSRERLEEYLAKGFEPATIDDFLEHQFTHHQLDDYFREKANDYKTRQAKQQVPLNRNPPPVPPKQ